jgi:alpha-ketoglutarate-dependent taurine dioxygenase
MSACLRRLPGCGAELELGPRQPGQPQLVDCSLSEADFALLQRGLREHRALLVRGQEHLPLGGLDALCRRMGGSAYDPSEHGAELPDSDRSRSYLVTNVADAATGRVREGELVSGSAEAGSAGNHEWHTDYCWKPVINPVTMLLCRRFTCSQGGQTQLADTAAALNALPSSVRRRITGLETTHGGVNFPAVRQPLIIESSLSHCPALLVGRHAKGVHGLGEVESAALLSELNDHCTRPEFVCAPCIHYGCSTMPCPHRNRRSTTPMRNRRPQPLQRSLLHDGRPMQNLMKYACSPSVIGVHANVNVCMHRYTHEWLPGDLLLWDNTSTLHRAVAGGGGVRELERCIMSPLPAAAAAL